MFQSERVQNRLLRSTGYKDEMKANRLGLALWILQILWIGAEEGT